jgi:hypothetical protein
MGAGPHGGLGARLRREAYIGVLRVQDHMTALEPVSMGRLGPQVAMGVVWDHIALTGRSFD